MARTVKKLLQTTATEIFYNWNDRPGSLIKATNITLCNTSASPVTVYLSFVVLSGLFIAGAVLSGVVVPANETITTEITERVVGMDESIKAYASVADVVSLSIDLVGDIKPEPDVIP